MPKLAKGPYWPHCEPHGQGLLAQAYGCRRTSPTALRFLEQSPQGPEPDVTGYKGSCYHFLEMKDGRRAGKCELSTVDSAFLLAGMLAAELF